MKICPNCEEKVVKQNGVYYCENPYCEWEMADKQTSLTRLKKQLREALDRYPDLRTPLLCYIERGR